MQCNVMNMYCWNIANQKMHVLVKWKSQNLLVIPLTQNSHIKKNNAMKMYFWNIANHVSLSNKLTPPLPWPSTYPDNVLFFGPIIREMWLWSVRLLVDYIGVLKWYLKHTFVSRYQLPTHHCFVSHFLLAWIPISKATICAKLQGVLMQSHTITAE